jgi:hypothetical protein
MGVFHPVRPKVFPVFVEPNWISSVVPAGGGGGGADVVVLRADE